MARRNRRISDRQHSTVRVRSMRRSEVAAVQIIARDLRPLFLLTAGGAR